MNKSCHCFAVFSFVYYLSILFTVLCVVAQQKEQIKWQFLQLITINKIELLQLCFACVMLKSVFDSSMVDSNIATNIKNKIFMNNIIAKDCESS